MYKIFKYDLIPDEPREILMMPVGARPLKVLVQREIPVLFAEVDDEQTLVPRIFRKVTTGEIFEGMPGCEYIDTVFLGGDKPEEAWYTMHVYEQVRNIPDPVHPRFKEDREQLETELRDKLGFNIQVEEE